jgi:hypothetical protein
MYFVTGSATDAAQPRKRTQIVLTKIASQSEENRGLILSDGTGKEGPRNYSAALATRVSTTAMFCSKPGGKLWRSFR